MLLRWVVAVAMSIAAVVPVAANVITDENARPGTSLWKVLNLATAGQIEGYASLTSVAPGETIRLYVSTSDPTYSLEIFRMGYYGGLGGRLMQPAVQRTGFRQAAPYVDPVTGLIECSWSDPYNLTIPQDWVSGVYLAKLTAQPGGFGAYIIFVVRSTPQRSARYIVQTSVTTYQAYNNWGGRSLYGFNSSGPHATKVSFNRPYVSSSGAGDFLFGYEYPTVRFLERNGYDVTYTTDIDTQERGNDITKSAVFLVIGHDEYWTAEMRTAVERARDNGVDLAFFSANICYWQIRLEPSVFGGEQNRTVVGYKDFAATDPVLLDGDPSNDRFATVRWRDFPVSNPEDQFIGNMYTYATIKTDVVVDDVSHWIFAGSGLKPGDHIKGLLGYEVDRATWSAHLGTLVLTRSPFQESTGTWNESNMTMYQANSGAMVFAGGTIYWGWGLDDFNALARPQAPPSPALQKITKNILDRMGEEEQLGRRRVTKR